MKTILTLLFCLGMQCIKVDLSIAAEPPKPRNGDKILIVNDDGFSQFNSGRYRSAADLRKAMMAYKETQIAVVEWCVIAGSRSNYPSRVTELIGAGMTEFPRRGDKLAHETLKRLADEGTHTLKIVADACHEAGVDCYASLRMNGDYSEKTWDGSLAKFLNSTFWHKHPELRVVDAKGQITNRLSFAYPAVQEFKLNILREVLQQDIDGINLDFHRHPSFFGLEEPMAVAFQAKYGIAAKTVPLDDQRWNSLRYEHMTGFVKEVRNLLDEAGKARGKHLGLSVRIDWQKYPTWGCDVETWLMDDLLDYLVVGQYGHGGYVFDIAPFVKMARGNGCAVLFGEEATIKGHDRTAEEDRLIAAGKMQPHKNLVLTREQYQQRAAMWYAAGSDGIHVFNQSSPAVLDGLGNATVGVPK
jgi:Glycosyl hydrolase-like 10